jgi:pimeloyl-ACP methyl ester carboxylesterase
MKSIKLSNGRTIAYSEAGSGQPIVVLHGYCGSHRYWDEVVPLLASRGRVIAPDLRGHGESSAGEGIYSMEALADDIAALLDALEIPKANLFGHSLGGYAALAFAEKYEERLAAFGLVHSTTYPDSEPAQANRLKAVDTIRTEGVAAFVEGLIPKLFAPDHKASMPEKLQKAVDIGLETSPDGAIGCALGMRERPDRTAVLEGLKVPVLLLAGELDEVIPPEKRFPVTKDNVAQILLNNVAHMGMVEDPKAFADAINLFLDDNRG